MRLLVSLILISGTSVSLTAQTGVPFNGKSGEELHRAVAVASRPQSLVDRSRLTFSLIDEFNGIEIEVVRGQLPGGYVWGNLVPTEWWSSATDNLQAGVAGDLFNLIPMDVETAGNRGELAPERVTQPTYSNPFWCAGRGEVAGVVTELYDPPKALRGALARAYFYVSTVYHSDVWTPRAYMMLTSASYPGLTQYAMPLLMEWHRENPPSAPEMEKNQIGEMTQGSRNPFVDYPELPEYIWGNRVGDVFQLPGEPVSLRSSYSVDETVDFYSPWIPSDADWLVDGQRVFTSSMSAAQLGTGNHSIIYTSPSTGETGRVMIKITGK